MYAEPGVQLLGSLSVRTNAIHFRRTLSSAGNWWRLTPSAFVLLQNITTQSFPGFRFLRFECCCFLSISQMSMRLWITWARYLIYFLDFMSSFEKHYVLIISVLLLISVVWLYVAGSFVFLTRTLRFICLVQEVSWHELRCFPLSGLEFRIRSVGLSYLDKSPRQMSMSDLLFTQLIFLETSNLSGQDWLHHAFRRNCETTLVCSFFLNAVLPGLQLSCSYEYRHIIRRVTVIQPFQRKYFISCVVFHSL